MRSYHLMAFLTQTAVLVVAASPGADHLTLSNFMASTRNGMVRLTTSMGIVSFQETGDWLAGDKFTLLIDDKPVALKGSDLDIGGFGTLGGKDFLIVIQTLSAGASGRDYSTFILTRDQNAGVKTIPLNGRCCDVITMKDKQLILSDKGSGDRLSGTVTWDGTNVSFSPYVRPAPIGKFDLRQINGKNISSFWEDPGFRAILLRVVGDDAGISELQYRFAMGGKFIKSGGFYCTIGNPQHMADGDDNAILAISENGLKVHIAYLKGGKEFNYGGFTKLTDLCPWMKQESFKLVETFHANTGGYPNCNLPFPGSDAYYAQLPRTQFEHQVTLAAIRAKEGETKSLLWKNRIRYNTVSQDIPKETQKYQTWAMNELRPRYVEFVTIAGAYAKRFDQVALRDLLIKSNTQSLMK